MSAPLPPFTRLMLRFDTRLGRFIPGPSDGTKGTLVMTIDAAGRSVIPVFAHPFGPDGERVVGYQLAEDSPMYHPKDGLTWLNKTKGTK